MDTSQHPALLNADLWSYYNEGNNNVILRYVGPRDKQLSGMILRLRKSTNRQFYADPTLLREEEYNPLMTDNVFMKDVVLCKRLQSMTMVHVQEPFLRSVAARIQERDMQMIRSESSIDFQAESAMLATNFASFHEDDHEGENFNVLSFEIKPKSGVTEYVPSKTREFVEANQVEFEKFLKSDQAERFLNNKCSKFHVMQVSRKFLGKLKELSIYSPFDFFNLKDPKSTIKAVKEIMSQKQIYGRLFINGEETREINEEQVEMISQFLRESEVIHAIYKFQKFSTLSLEYVAYLYSLVQPELNDPIMREKHFVQIREYFSTFSFDTHYNISNERYEPQKEDLDFKRIWSLILGYMITATVKDFTIIMRILEPKNSEHVFTETSVVKQEQDMIYKGKHYRVRVGVIDLESKMYTKIPIYMKEVEEAYTNFVKYYNK